MLPVEYDAKAIKRLVDKTNNVFSSSNASITKSIIDLSTTSSEGDATNAASIVTEATARSDADSALASLITTLSATSSEGDATNAASIVTEATARSNGDSAVATTVTALAASTLAADTANAASVVAAATAASSATSALTNVVNAQRSLFGAAVSDTWDSTKQYIGSTETIDSVDVATGEEAVKGGLVYRCRATHTNQQPPSTSYWDLVDTVAAVVSASVLIESNTRASADLAQAQTSTAISGRVTTLEDDTTDADAAAVNAADIVTTNSLIVTNDSAYSERFELTAARFGITVTDTYDNARTYQIGEEAIYLSNLYRCTAISLGNIPTNTSFWAFQALVPADISAAVLTETNARVTADTALASDITTLTSTVTNNNNTLAAAVSSEASTRASADSAAASSISTVSASVATEATARANADTAEANARAAADNTITASVTTEASVRAATDNTLLAKYGVTLDSNGYITGFSQNNDGTSGQFKIIADDFRIIDPSDTAGEAGAQVFSVIGGIVTMDTAHIGNLTIGTGKITDNAVTVSSAAFTAAEYYTSYVVADGQSGWQDVQQVTFTQTANVPTQILWSLLGKVRAGTRFDDAEYANLEVRILRGTSVIINYGVVHTSNDANNLDVQSMINGSLIDTPSTGGSVTYKIQVKRTGEKAQVSNRSLVTTELKK